MEKIYNDAKDKNVATYVIYANVDNEFFFDAEATSPVAAEEMLDLFVKGVVCVKDDVYYIAKSCTKAGVIDFGFPAA